MIHWRKFITILENTHIKFSIKPFIQLTFHFNSMTAARLAHYQLIHYQVITLLQTGIMSLTLNVQLQTVFKMLVFMLG